MKKDSDRFRIKQTRRDGPEAKIQEAIIKKLKLLDWYALSTYGNIYQSGFPDLFVCHSRYGQRWIEVKNLLGYSFTPAQLEVFPKLCAHGSGVWILVNDSDEEIAKLFKPFNWYWYLSVWSGR